MALEQRPEPQQLLAVGVTPDDGVRIAHGDAGELDPLIAELDRLRLVHLDRPDLEPDLRTMDCPCVLPPRDRDGDLHSARAFRKPGGGNARAVTGELGHRSVRVPDHDLGSRSGGRDDLEDTVGTEPVANVTESRDLLGVERAAELSLIDEQVAVAERVPF